MTAASDSVWAIDIGSSSLKALHLTNEQGPVEVLGFDNIRHGKILTQSGISDAEKEEIIALSLRRLIDKHDLSMDDVVVAVPSQNSFARFVDLPPVDSKRIPEIVRFEAVQQIPFDINDVQWDWQLMTAEDSPQLKVGIFAIKNDVINTALEHFSPDDFQISCVQMAPMALYNYILHDRPDLVNSDSKATVVLNVGAEITDLVVCTKSAVWQRCILLGGNSFTRAIADTFRLSFEKAEKLKRTAPVSKYARQIFQAMRPVFTDLASEVQRSLGFYKSANPDTKITRIVGMGGGTKLRGLLKYLQQTVQIPVERPDAFKKLRVASGVPAAKFGENVGDFAVVYGLAVQGLGLAGIESNLLPKSMRRSIAWAGKGRWFLMTACMLLGVSVMALGSRLFDKMGYEGKSGVRGQVNRVLAAATTASRNLSEAERNIEEHESAIARHLKPFEYRRMIPHLHETLWSALPNAENNPDQAGLYEAFDRGDAGGVMEFERDRKLRKQLFVTNMTVFYTKNLSTAKFGQADMWRSIAGLSSMDEEDEEDEDDRFIPSRYALTTMDQVEQGPSVEAIEMEREGFVVTIAGYSPYKDIESLIDPSGVREDNQERWGFVTRLLHLEDLAADPNSVAFELVGKTNPKHFKPAIGDVAVGGREEIPAGIGEQKIKYDAPLPGDRAGSRGRAELILVDPMTKELISRIPEMGPDGRQKYVHGEPVYQVNDHWFVLNMKFAWKNGPRAGESAAERPGGPTTISY